METGLFVQFSILVLTDSMNVPMSTANLEIPVPLASLTARFMLRTKCDLYFVALYESLFLCAIAKANTESEWRHNTRIIR